MRWSKKQLEKINKKVDKILLDEMLCFNKKGYPNIRNKKNRDSLTVKVLVGKLLNHIIVIVNPEFWGNINSKCMLLKKGLEWSKSR